MKTFFVSSTFWDMHNERDCMHNIIIPELNEEAARYGEALAIRDLRWGVNTKNTEDEEKADKKVLDVCLDEIDRCRPYLIVLLGERYGFQPGKELIQKAAENRGFRLSEEEDTDEGADISVTELEIRYGILAAEKPKVCVYMRTFANGNEEEIPKICRAENDECAAKLKSLKERIKKWETDKDIVIQDYQVKCDAKSEEIENLDSFREKIVDDIKNMLKQEWEELKNLTNNQREIKRHWEYAKVKDARYCERSVDKEIRNKLSGKNFVVVQGEAGSGKSAALSHLALGLKKEKGKVLPLFCGYTPLTCRSLEIFKRLVEFLAEELGEEGKEEAAGWEEWRARLERQIKQVSQKAEQENTRLVILLDGVDQLNADEIRDNLLFIPPNLFSRVQVVVSCVCKFALPDWIEKDCIVRIEAIQSGDEKKEILRNMHASTGREPYQEILDWIQENKAGADNPLYLSMLVQRLEMMRKEDFERIDAQGSHDDASIEYQKKLIEKCPESREDMCVHILEKASEIIHAFPVKDAVKYIAASRYGLRETDLERLFKENWSDLNFLGFYKYMRNLFIVREDGRYDFSHRIIRDGYVRRYAGEEMKLHKDILTHLKGLPSYDSVRMDELIYHCYQANDKEYFVKYLCWKGQDDKLDAEGKRKVFKAAARGVYEICIRDVTWFCNILGQCEPWEKPQETAGMLQFVDKFLSGMFEGTVKELEIQEKIYTKCLRLAERLYQSQENEESMEILSRCYYHLGDICHKAGGSQNYSRAFRMYSKERELAQRLSGRERKEGDIGRQIDSQLHLGDIYMSMGGRENRNHAKRLYSKAEELAKENGEERRQSFCWEKLGDIEALGLDSDLKKVRGFFEKAEGFILKNQGAVEWERFIQELPSADKKRLVRLYIRTGDILADLCRNKKSKALEFYKKAMKIAQIMEKEPPVRENRIYRILCCERCILGGEGEYEGIIKEMEESEGGLYRKKVLAAFWEHEGSRLLHLKRTEESLQKAETNFRKAEAVIREICQDRNEAENQRDLMVICYKLGSVFFQQEKEGGKLEEKTVRGMLGYCTEAHETAEHLRKELGTIESRVDEMVTNTRMGDVYCFLECKAFRRMAEERYMQSLDVAISLMVETKSPIYRMAVSVLCGKIADITNDSAVKKQMEERSERLSGSIENADERLYEKDIFDLHCKVPLP